MSLPGIARTKIIPDTRIKRPGAETAREQVFAGVKIILDTKI